MQIVWLKSVEDFVSLGINIENQNGSSGFPSLGQRAKGKIKMIFNHKNSMKSFIEQFCRFSLLQNQIEISFGLLTEKELNAEHINEFDIQDPFVFFGSQIQQESFLKIFKDKCAFIENSCDNKTKTIAYQRHLTDKVHHHSVSLGEYKTDFSKAESTLRSTQALFFNVNAIRRQDSFHKDSKLTGLDIYESCQLLRFYAMSASQNFLFINISHHSLSEETWECIATNFWYYLEGKNQIEIDNVEDKENKVYLVESTFFNKPLSFIQAQQTKRWWFIHPETKESIPCSEGDYLAIREGTIPNILLDLCVA